MWVDEGGVAHTVALPDPSDLMSDGIQAQLRLLAREDAGQLWVELDACEAQVYEEILARHWDPESEAEYVRAPPPVGLLAGWIATPKDLHDVLTRTDLRWRLDVICAVGDFIDV